MKIICIGRNYRDHISELGNNFTESPLIFLKPDTSIIQKDQPFYIPHFSSLIHHEVELIVKINKIGKHISKRFAYKYYQKISLGIDFTARDLQVDLKQKGLPWEKSKGFDGSAVVGDWFDKTKFDNINCLDFQLYKNGIITQNDNTSNMIFSIDELISEISKFFTLKIGDIIFTGTPSGVGKVKENDFLEGFLMDKRVFKVRVK